MSPIIRRILVFVFIVVSLEHKAIATDVYSSVVLPITKHTDSVKPLYSVEVTVSGYTYTEYLHSNLLLDLDAPLIYHGCDTGFNVIPGRCVGTPPCATPVSCLEEQCTNVRTSFSFNNPSCPPVTNDSIADGWGFCSCPVDVVNLVTKSCGQGLLSYDAFWVNTSNGKNIFTGLYPAYPNAACAYDSSLYESFPANVKGVMSFSQSHYALPSYLANSFKKILALCLPSTVTSRGVLFYGNGPYFLRSIDVRRFLSYTPLVKHPKNVNSFGYFVSVNAIVIKKRSVSIDPTNTFTKISTVEPYTVLRSDIYKPLVRRFLKVTKRIPMAKAVAPFGVCFKGSLVNGLKVPDIELGFEGGKKWSISTVNSMKQVTKDVVCLAFVDGGAMTTSESAIVIGSFQYEDNFVVFDLENSSFGFSSSVFQKQNSCSNFNFTLVDGGS